MTTNSTEYGQMHSPRCQVHDIPRLAEPLGMGEIVRQISHRIRRIVKRRYRYVTNMMAECAANVRTGTVQTMENSNAQAVFQAGEYVRVKSREEIQKTLDRWNQLQKCSFMEEMWPYCGTRQRVLKRVERFFDERDYRLKKCRGIYLLEGAMCQGTKDFGPCDRSCFFFWKEDWLERVEQ